MKFGLISVDFRRLPLLKCFETAKKYNFRAVELWGGRPHAYPPDMGKDEIKTILRYKQEFQLETPMYTPNVLGLPLNLCSQSVVERTEGMNYHKLAIDVAASLEIPKMLVVADHPGLDADVYEIRKIFTDEIDQLVHYGEKKGVIICVEPMTPMESPVITSSWDCLNLMHEIPSPNLNFVLDIIPPTVISEPISNYFTLLGKRASHVHIANSNGKTDAHLQLDQGCINISDILQIIQNHGYDQYVIVELYSISINDPEMAIANAARTLSLCS